MALPIRVKAQGLWVDVNLESLARRRNLAAYDAAYLDLMNAKSGAESPAQATGLPHSTYCPGPRKTTPTTIRKRPKNFTRVSGSLKKMRDQSSVKM